MSALRIERTVGLAFVQDGGRRGRLHEGVPPGGALSRDALARANAAVGNSVDAAGIERYGAMTISARGELLVADDDGRAWTLREGEALALPWDGSRRARYLAVRGGIDVPVVLGGRGTLVAASIGGLEGRPLRKGDELSIGELAPSALASRSARASRETTRLVPGPDLGAYAPDALDALTSRAWRISPRSDRTGTRLEGATIPWREGAPSARTTPMVAGAIELPPGGEPIVLGPDHPTTGGYPVVAVIARVDLDDFHLLPLGREVRFEAITLDAARGLLRDALDQGA